MARAKQAEMTSDGPVLAALAKRRGDDTLLVEVSEATTTADAIRFVERLEAALRHADLDETSRVCVVMTNGRLLALTALGLLAFGGFAPLNPRLTEDEFVRSFSDLDADALITTAGFAPNARVAAGRCGMAIIEVADDAEFTLLQKRTCVPAESPPGYSLLLHTSGTTSRPKLVGLTAANLLSSASSVAATLQLTPRDRCLNVMPLFHIHGLVGVLLASVIAGSSVELSPKFDAFAYRRQLAGPDITWTSAVPSMYRAVMSRTSTIRAGANLRLLRSSSAPLPTGLQRELEEEFACPVINAYGMTEASHQMTSNPVPPGDRRPGSVGRSAGAEVAVLVEGEITSTPGVIGEVVVRGPGVIEAYLSPASANETSWHEGWFRTGDLGSLDADGYLTLHGRIKEIINVAGEKVSPYEVEAAFLEHPAVVDAVAFAAPDHLRGEQVAVAVVLRDGVGSVEVSDIRRFGADRLASFKTPRTVVDLEQIPLGPTGKVQRSKLSSLLGIGEDEPDSGQS